MELVRLVLTLFNLISLLMCPCGKVYTPSNALGKGRMSQANNNNNNNNVLRESGNPSM